MVVHDPRIDRCGFRRYSGTALSHHAAGFVTANDWRYIISQTECPLRFPWWRPIELEIAAAHSRRLDLEHDLAGAGSRIRNFAQVQLTVPKEIQSTHDRLVATAPGRDRAWNCCGRGCCRAMRRPAVCPNYPAESVSGVMPTARDGCGASWACLIGHGRPFAFACRFMCSMVECALLRSGGRPAARI